MAHITGKPMADHTEYRHHRGRSRHALAVAAVDGGLVRGGKQIALGERRGRCPAQPQVAEPAHGAGRALRGP